MDSTGKRLKNDGIDRISSMPDSILGKILSYLPTKNALATRVLSTSWKTVIPFGVPPIKVDFDDSALLLPNANESKSPSTSFVDFVDKFLNETLCNGPCVDKFVLKCKEHYDDGKIISWVRAALRLKVRELVLEIFLDDPHTLFSCLNGCETLVKLDLGKNFDLDIPEGFTLPNLKWLILHSLILLDEDSDWINELLVGCPLLEKLYIVSCNLQQFGYVLIKSFLLKSLVIEDSWTNSSCQLAIHTPNLEFLWLCDSVAWGYSLSNFNSVLAAHIDVGPTQEQHDEIDEHSDDEALAGYDEGVTELVTACSSTSRLYLATCSLAALVRSSAQLPEFQNLFWLALGSIPGNSWELLANLLLSAPNLKKLTIEEEFKDCEGGYARFESLLPSPPICLQLNLKEIEFWVFNGGEDEFKLVNYFLKNGVLQKLKLHCLPCEDLSIWRRIIPLQESSKTCRVILGEKQMDDNMSSCCWLNLG